jgi:hypothetical protein
MLGVRRTPAVKGLPRSRWLPALGIHDSLRTFDKPKTRPTWPAQETWAALLEALGLREGCDPPSMSGYRTRRVTLVTTRLAAEVYSIANRAELSRLRWQAETALAPRKTTRQMGVLHGKTVPGVLKEWTVFALVDHLARMVMWQSTARQHMSVERMSFLDALR